MSEANFFVIMLRFLTGEAGKAVLAAIQAIVGFFQTNEKKELPPPKK